MKRFNAYLLTLLMLLITMQPTIAMHFCGGELAEFQLYEKSTMNCDNCTQADDAHPKAQSFQGTDCCSLNNVQLTTDSYEHSPSILKSLALTTVAPYFVLFDVVPNYEAIADEPLTLVTRKFPPKGLSRDSYDLNDFICIYRL